ncbi:urease subunit beta [Streptomyces sp. NPDC002671]
MWVKDPTTNHVLNSQGDKATLYVLNIGDRAIQIGSHIHLGDVNENLLFFDEDGATELDDFLKNTQDRDARVAEANRLQLDRSKTSGQAPWGCRLDIAPGDSERFSPEFAPSDPIQVVKIGGRRRVPGLSKGKTDVALD